VDLYILEIISFKLAAAEAEARNEEADLGNGSATRRRNGLRTMAE